MILSLALALWVGTVEAKSYRDPQVRAEFMKLQPCPSTGKRSGPCKNYNVDHIIPLCFHGVDELWNLQWLTVKEHREKTKLDVKVCKWDGK